MNIQQRLTQLESYLKPKTNNPEPLLVKFVDSDPETGEVIGTGGILYVYDGVPASTYELDRKQLEAYEATGEYKSVSLDNVYNKTPNFRIESHKKYEP